ncbi:hypothetical protein VD659_04700 [Herbiconiux sp. 11R-BC]|uniref:hypothetical protein n=1 Tax=Herbiconiux sp. 11R-BC TaxID=3111637 RepID=UPI003C0DD478
MAELLHAGALLPAAVGACCTLGSVRSRRLAAALSAIVMLLAMVDATTGLLRVPPFVWTAVLVAAALAAALAGRLASGAPGAPHPGGARALAHPSARTGWPGLRPAPDAAVRARVPGRRPAAAVRAPVSGRRLAVGAAVRVAYATRRPAAVGAVALRHPTADASGRTGVLGRRSAAVGAAVPVPARHAGAMAAHGSAGLLVTAGLLAAMGGAAGTSVAGASWGAGLAGSMHHAGSASGALLTMCGVGALVYIGLSVVLALRLPRTTLRDRMAVAEVASMAASTALMLAAALIP